MIDFLSQYINLTWVYWFLTVAYAVTIISIVGVIVSENRNPVKSLAWVTVLLALPALGLLLYVVFGRNIKNKRVISRRNRRRLRRRESSHKIDFARLPHSDSAKNLIRLGHSLSGAMYYRNNSATLYNNGTDKMDALIHDISQARNYINIQYYIINDDATGRRLRDALVERARAGVTVRLIYDHVGSFRVKNSFFKSMQAEGIQVYPFFKVTFPGLGSRINWRNHRKLCVVDGRVAYIGGMNIADRYIDGGRHFEVWRDSHLRLEGPAVAAVQYSFAVDWNFMGRPLLEDYVSTETAGDMGAQLITSGPTSQWSNVELVFLKAIAGARKRIFIQTPYFLPTDGLLKALQTAALSQVDVRIMMPRRSDSAMLRHASFSYIAECLRSGIKIYLYKPGMLHSKNIIIDEEIASVGSTNFDFRSFEHNFEANLFVYSRDFNRRLSDVFVADLKHSHRVLASHWSNRPRGMKVAESVIRLLSPIL